MHDLRELRTSHSKIPVVTGAVKMHFGVRSSQLSGAQVPSVPQLVKWMSGALEVPESYVRQIARALQTSGDLPKSAGRKIAVISTRDVAALLIACLSSTRISDVIINMDTVKEFKLDPFSLNFVRNLQDRREDITSIGPIDFMAEVISRVPPRLTAMWRFSRCRIEYAVSMNGTRPNFRFSHPSGIKETEFIMLFRESSDRTVPAGYGRSFRLSRTKGNVIDETYLLLEEEAPFNADKIEDATTIQEFKDEDFNKFPLPHNSDALVARLVDNLMELLRLQDVIDLAE